MDGFALISSDIEVASEDNPVELSVVADIPAGECYDKTVESGTCVRIMTGAPVPKGADTVVKFEIVTNLENEGHAPGRVAFNAPSPVGANIRNKGEEILKGEIALKAGDLINPAGAGLLASCGLSSVEVFRRPCVAIFSIGTELVDPDTVPQGGQIRDGNTYALAALVVQAGGIPLIKPIVADEKEALTATVLNAVITMTSIQLILVAFMLNLTVSPVCRWNSLIYLLGHRHQQRLLGRRSTETKG